MTTQASGQVVLVCCNGVSARGHVAARACHLVCESLSEVRSIEVVPLLAGVPEEVEALSRARVVLGLAGCDQRCDRGATRRVTGREPDESFVVGASLRAEVHEVADASEKELQSCTLELSSRIIGRVMTLT